MRVIKIGDSLCLLFNRRRLDSNGYLLNKYVVIRLQGCIPFITALRIFNKSYYRVTMPVPFCDYYGIVKGSSVAGKVNKK